MSKTKINKDYLFDKPSAMFVLGHVMANPHKLCMSQFLLTDNDFTKPLYKIVFGALYNMAVQGAQTIYPTDVDLYLATFPTQHEIFSKENGYKFLLQIEEMNIGHDEALFEKQYDTVKKFSILRDLESQGIDTTRFYDPSANILEGDVAKEKLIEMSTSSILDQVRVGLAQIEKININKDGNYLTTAGEGLMAMVEGFRANPAIGAELEGKIFNAVARGARPNMMIMFSAPQSNGKTTLYISQACKRALPYINDAGEVVIGDLRKTYYLATEQDEEELKPIMLAYVSGIERSKITDGNYTDEEYERIKKAVKLIEIYGDNLLFDRISQPTVSKVRNMILEKILQKGVEVIVYDYLFIPFEDGTGPNMYARLRTDQLLMMFSNELKELAVTYKRTLITGSQLTEVNESFSKPVARTQNLLRDAKSLSDKIDLGVIGCRLSSEELTKVAPLCEKLPVKPNYVKDVYKNRGGKIATCKIFSDFDFGTGRTTDLFITTQDYKPITVDEIIYEMSYIEPLDTFLQRGGKQNDV